MLQKMLNVCVDCVMEVDKLFNAKKSSLFKIGPTYKDQIEILKIGEQDTEWADSLRYLGVYFVLARVMMVDITVQMRKFYASANSILCNST